MYTVDNSKPVMVSGATGYVAGQIIKSLLEEGATVHAAVRDPNNKERLKYLKAIADASPGQIKFFKSNLMESGSYGEAMQGCAIVFHTASPFTIDVQDPQKELVDPARLGTQNVLEEANRQASVERVVLTSSCAAIYGDNADVLAAPAGVLTEEVWNTSSSIDHQAYSYSKTVAEQAAWEIAEAQDRWKLVVLNPALVIGPGINPNATSESFNIIRQIGDGTLKQGAPKLNFGVVDVRDLAAAHLAAAYIPEAQGRHIIAGHSSDLFSMSQTLLKKYGDTYPLPRKALPKWLLWLVGPFVDRNLTRKVVARNIDIEWKADNTKGIKQLGVSYRPLEESMNDFFEQQVQAGAFAQNN